MHYVRLILLCIAVYLLARDGTSQGATPIAPAGEKSTVAPAPVLAANQEDSSRLGGPASEGIEFFEAHIRPVLVDKCYQCHSADSKILQGGLRLDTAERLQAGGESGPAIVPNKPEESLLISALRYQNYEMPPSGKLPDEVINDFAKWIEMGAPDPRSQPMENEKATSNKPQDNPHDHWAYRLPQRIIPPQTANAATVRCDIDRFILARLEAAKLTSSPIAPPRTLYRRLYYDLTGLPPSAEELDAFAADPSDAKYEATVDRLLASPRFGERWARHWLDIARYADTKGYVFQEDRNYKQAYTYRDWVIASFNSDRPFDNFVTAQLAEDQLDDKSCAPATGFLTLGRRFLNVQADIINDRIDVISRGLLGLTVACARCHDHKFDPISTADYYALYGVLASSSEKERPGALPQFAENETPLSPVIFIRGNSGSPGPKVDRRFLTILSPDQKPTPFNVRSGRLELAKAIASRDNPLTARVWTNRVWGYLFGHGIVDTPSDFGSRGTPPTHPELLDTLACDLMDNGWSTKHLIREIVLSGTYRQCSDSRAECAAIDPDNKFYWRANRRRLDLEALRDSLLVAAGRLDNAMGGPSVSLTDAPFTTRRSVYGFIERQNLPAFFRTFDFANPNTHSADRPQTTAPQQALFLMNSPFAIEQATFLASRIESSAASQTNVPFTDSAAERVRRINRLFRCALGRDANIDELTDTLEFLERGGPSATAPTNSQLAWQFGWGTVDKPPRLVQFRPLPFFTNGTWQGSSQLPDPTLGWVLLNATGGHPGDTDHAAIRRWTAPANGKLFIEGVLDHSQPDSDGVRGRIVCSRTGLVGSWEVARSQAATKPQPIEVQKGDTIDFVTDSRDYVTSDGFNWTVTLRLATSDKDPGQLWDSSAGFHGPLAPPLSRWQELAQILLVSNEFAFVD